jgi:hypothetical protein
MRFTTICILLLALLVPVLVIGASPPVAQVSDTGNIPVATAEQYQSFVGDATAAPRDLLTLLRAEQQVLHRKNPNRIYPRQITTYGHQDRWSVMLSGAMDMAKLQHPFVIKLENSSEKLGINDVQYFIAENGAAALKDTPKTTQLIVRTLPGTNTRQGNSDLKVTVTVSIKTPAGIEHYTATIQQF